MPPRKKTDDLQAKIALLFLIFAAVLEGMLAMYWLVFLEPRLEKEAEISAMALAQSHEGILVEILTSMNGETRRKGIIQALERACLITDPNTGTPMIMRAELEVDYDVVNAKEGELNLKGGSEPCPGCLATQIPLYSKTTKELLGILRIHYSRELFLGFRKYMRVTLIALAAMGPVILILVWYTVDGMLKKIRRKISELEKTEKALKAAKTEAEFASNAKSKFLAHMSHEFRTPLNAIQGIGYGLQSSVKSIKNRELVQELNLAARHLGDIIGDILDLSRIESGRLELENIPFHLPELLQKQLSTLKSRARMEQISLHWEVDSNVPEYLRGDPLRIKQILYNLVGNSLKFVDQGDIAVRVRNPGHEPQGLCGIEIEVTDTGRGIPEEKLKTIFDAFEQVNQGTSAGGTGLGLTITRELARMMGGDAGIRSAPGRGTTVLVQLYLEKAQPEDVKKAPVERISVKPGTALIVDDAPSNRKMLQFLLESEGWETYGTENGLKAIALLEKGVNVDIIFMDISMPLMDGTKVTRRIKAHPDWESIPIVALTAHAMTGDKEKFLKAGMDGYLAKPINFAQLWSEISRLLAQNKEAGSAPSLAENLVGTDMDQGEPSGASNQPSIRPCMFNEQDDKILEYEKLLHLFNSEKQVVKGLINELLEESKELVTEAEIALAAQDPEKIRKICHQLSGSASNLAAKELALAAEKLGQFAKQGNKGHMSQSLQELKIALERLNSSALQNFHDVKSLPAKEETDSKYASGNKGMPGDAQLSDLLARLRESIQDWNPSRAQSIVESLKTYLRKIGLGEEMNRLLISIKDFDFSKAEEIVEDISQKVRTKR